AAQSGPVKGGTMRLEVTVFKTGQNTQESAGLSTTSTAVLNQTPATPTETDTGPTTGAVWGQTPTMAAISRSARSGSSSSTDDPECPDRVGMASRRSRLPMERPGTAGSGRLHKREGA